MWWIALAQMGLSLANGLGQAGMQKAQYKAQRTLDQAEVDANNRIREANNELGRAQAGLTNWMRSVSNQRTIEAAGEQYNAFTENLGRAMDQAVTGNMQRRIQAAEQAGAITASAAAAGVGGSTVDLINGTLRMRNAMVNAEIEKQEGQATYDQLMQRAGVLDNGYDQWDYSYNAVNSNFMSSQMPIRVEPSDSSWKSVLLETTLGAAGNLFNKSGDKSGPLSLLQKLGMGGGQASGSGSGSALGFLGNLFGSSGQATSGASNTQLGTGINPATARLGLTYSNLRL